MLVQINVNKMRIFRPILNRYLSPTIKNVHGRMIKPMVSLACPIDVAMKTKTSPLSLSTIRFLSDQSINKTEQNKEEVGKSADTDALEVDLSQFTEEVPIYLPDLGETSGTVLKWHKKEGDIIRHGDTLCDIETELFTFGMDTDDECLGILSKVVAQQDEKLKPHSLLCVVLHQPGK